MGVNKLLSVADGLPDSVICRNHTLADRVLGQFFGAGEPFAMFRSFFVKRGEM